LEGLGQSGFEIRSGGAIGGPVDRFQEVVRHVEAGCVIYSTVGFSEEGVRVYWLAGE
jgi:hypothetical protein